MSCACHVNDHEFSPNMYIKYSLAALEDLQNSPASIFDKSIVLTFFDLHLSSTEPRLINVTILCVPRKLE